MSIIRPQDIQEDEWAEILPTLYDVDDHPFEFMYLGYEELPDHAQKFLKEEGFYPLPAPTSDPTKYFPNLYEARKRRSERLVRTLYGVSRDIAKRMNAKPPTSDDMDVITNVLMPEWRSHLDAYMEEMDALAWFDLTVRKGTQYAQSPGTIYEDRKKDVETMVKLALKVSQKADERMKLEALDEAIIHYLSQRVRGDRGHQYLAQSRDMVTGSVGRFNKVYRSL